MSTSPPTKSLPDLTSLSQPRLLGDGQTVVEFDLYAQAEINDFTMFTMSDVSLDNLLPYLAPQRETSSDTQESVIPAKRKILKRKKPQSEGNTPESPKSSKTSARRLTTPEKDSKSSSIELMREISPHLWLPVETGSAGLVSSSSIDSCEGPTRNLSYCTRKQVLPLGVRANLPMISSTRANSFYPPGILTEHQEEMSPEIRTISYRLELTKKQKQTFQRWCRGTTLVYNKCVEFCNRLSEIPDKKVLRNRFIANEANEVYTTDEYNLLFAKPRIPYAILDSVIQDFREAFFLQKRLVKEKKRKMFTMKPRTHNQHTSFEIPHARSLKRISIASSTQTKYMLYDHSLGVITVNEYVPFTITHNCRLSWNGLDVYMIHVPREYNPINTKHSPKGVCAIDPGERTFGTVYGTDGVMRHFGDGFSKKIYKWACIAQRMREGIARTVDDEGKRVFARAKKRRTRKHLKKIAKRMETRTTNKITNFHYAVIKTLTNTYETIIIPVFATQQMTEKYNKDGIWKRKLGKGVVRRLLRLSHYKFRKRIIAKAGNRVVVGTEEWTSKMCGNCFNINYDLGASKVFTCPHCGVVMGRDDNGARNIMLLNWERATLQIQQGGVFTPNTDRVLSSRVDDIAGLK